MNKENSDTYSVTCRCPRLLIFVLAAALVFGAVCVGGVSGATWYIPNEKGLTLAQIVTNAADGDTIVIKEDYVINSQVVMDSVETMDGAVGKTITIINAPGKHVKISSGLGSLTSGSNTQVDTKTLFKINAGKLIVKSNDDGGSITITTNKNGRAFDVNYDDRMYAYGDNVPATLFIEGDVSITNCGFADKDLAESNNGGAVYVRPAGTFIMNESCSLYDNQAGGGGAVYVDQKKERSLIYWGTPLKGGTFILNGGSITGNYAVNVDSSHARYGGGVCIHSSGGNFEWYYPAEITGNGAEGIPDGEDKKNYINVYPLDYYTPPTAPELPEEPEVPPEVVYYPIYVVAGTDVYNGYYTIREAYEDAVKKGKTTFTICLRENHIQEYKSVEQNGITATILDAVTIGNGIHVTLQPDAVSVTVTLRDRMFVVSSGGSLTISDNTTSHAKLSVTGGRSSLDGGFVSVDGGTLTLKNVDISEVRGKNGGAIYIANSGDCTVIGGSIKDCAADNGEAIYVAAGSITVSGSFSIVDSNDIYLAQNQVITISSDYSGKIERITLQYYEEERRVVNITAKSTIPSENFVLNPDDADKYGDMHLMRLGDESEMYLVLGVDCDFLIIIPEDLALSPSMDGVMTVIAQDVVIPRDDWISVSVSSLNNFNLTLRENDSIRLVYTITLDDGTAITQENSEVARFTESGSVDMNVRVTSTPQYSGSYADSLTFTVQYGTA